MIWCQNERRGGGDSIMEVVRLEVSRVVKL